ncbi:MAG TPA: dienelactone hydrolase family protein [Gemmatimonadaceae bacterium]|jgi:carboxymethylenebutenolidase|nr:dienelactone hydrolase family protein [Gemmatimonadaceae bacterium]
MPKESSRITLHVPPIPPVANHAAGAGESNQDLSSTEMGAYVVRPESPGPHPAMMVLQEALGVNAQIRGVADRYAELGFVAIAPDLFHRVRPGYETSEFRLDELMALVRTLTTEGLIADATAAFDWLSQQPDVQRAKIAAVGYCMGGRATYLANSALPLAAAISYYGGSIAPALLDRATQLHGPHLFFWGGRDTGIPPEQRRAVADAVRSAEKQFVDVEFSDATHAFFNEQADRYNPRAAAQSWALGISFLEDALGVTVPH